MNRPTDQEIMNWTAEEIEAGLKDCKSWVCEAVSKMMGKEWKHDADLDPEATAPLNDDFICLKCKANMRNPKDWHLPCPYPDPIDKTLGDLAFELRDKTLELPNSWGWLVAMEDVFIKKECKILPGVNSEKWFKALAKPEHWIKAALMAWKEKEDE